MSKSKRVWIPSIIALVVTVLFMGYYYYYISWYGNGDSALKKLAEEQLAKGFVDRNLKFNTILPEKIGASSCGNSTKIASSPHHGE
ncbi:hypothetical protein [Paenibacillus sp. RC67]|uniref:hypothetical protein n=1 Tax=Paenibacillus sp. RC67 TaxID=3039392 RepID=UPI0024ACCDC9|nr:hypothetical protein [Paenibacillus sp. RC67]